MENKVCLITGANTGIGYETALALAQKKGVIVIVSRDLDKGEKAVYKIRSKTKNENIFLLQADLSSLNSVRNLAAEFGSRFDKLHVLINNAGVFEQDFITSADGFENTFAVNYLAPFLLTNLLMEKILGSVPARIINVSSKTHFNTKFEFPDLKNQNNYNPHKAYAFSKLALIMASYKFAEKLQNTGVTVNSLHPGVVATNLLSDFRGKKRGSSMGFLLRFRNLSPSQGAKTSVYLASSPEAAKETGKYWVNCKPVNSSVASYNKNNIDRLWNISCEMSGLVPTKKSV